MGKTIVALHLKLEQGSVAAVAAIIVLTAINLRSVKVAAWLHNLTALAYLVVVFGIVAAGFAWGHASWSHFQLQPGSHAAPVTAAGAGVAMIALLYSYDGWEFLSWVGGEIKDPRRNLPLALIFGIFLVVITYLLANAVFLYALMPLHRAQTSAPATAAMGALFWPMWPMGGAVLRTHLFGGASVVVSWEPNSLLDGDGDSSPR